MKQKTLLTVIALGGLVTLAAPALAQHGHDGRDRAHVDAPVQSHAGRGEGRHGKNIAPRRRGHGENFHVPQHGRQFHRGWRRHYAAHHRLQRRLARRHYRQRRHQWLFGFSF